MTFKTTIALTVATMMALPMTASAFTAENYVEVTPRGGSSFEVERDGRFGVPGQWCAAADYAVRALGVGWTNRIYVQGPGRTSRSVVFGMTPAGAQPTEITGVAASARIPGSNFSVQRAFAYCIQQRLPSELYD